MWYLPVLEALGVDPERGRNGRWRMRCPVHDDRTPSASVWLGRNEDRLLIGCWSGCNKEEMLAAKGLKMQDLFKREDGPYNSRYAGGKYRREVAWYPYCDEDGELLFEKVRTDPKGFFQRRPVGQSWVNGTEGVRKVPWRLHEMVRRPGWPVIIADGEEDVLALEELGMLGTCAPEGMNNWREEYGAVLKGRRVAVIPDRDHTEKRVVPLMLGMILLAGAESVQVVRLPAKDVRDWLVNVVPEEVRERLIQHIREARVFSSAKTSYGN